MMDCTRTRACPSSALLSAAGRVYPTGGVKPGNDDDIECAVEKLHKRQCTLTVSSWLFAASAIADSRLSVSRIGLPSAACRTNTRCPASSTGASAQRNATSSERMALMYAIRFSPNVANVSGDIAVRRAADDSNMTPLLALRVAN